MKDLYSFHTSVEDLKRFYEEAKEAYWKVFTRVGLKEKTKIVLASGGDFTEDYSHEFQTVCDSGEDQVFYAQSKDIAFNKEIAPSKAPKFEQGDQKELPMEDVESPGVVGVRALVKLLGVPVEQTTKTMIFETENGVVAAALRGDYEINELKLKKVLGCKTLKLASPEVIQKVTNAEVGYAGLLNLSSDVRVVVDDSIEGTVNLEMGANKTNYHTKNVNFGRDLPRPERFYDIKEAKIGDLYPETGEVYEVLKMAEVGNIFPLHTKFTKAFNYTFKDEQGKEQPIYMGSYGIGPSRVMGVVVEVTSDEKGLCWPETIAPFKAHLLALDLRDEEIKSRAEEVYAALLKAGVEVLYDDRDTSAGAKFADSDLIGIPYRLVVSKRTEGKIECKKRTENDAVLKTLEEVISLLS